MVVATPDSSWQVLCANVDAPARSRRIRRLAQFSQREHLQCSVPYLGIFIAMGTPCSTTIIHNGCTTPRRLPPSMWAKRLIRMRRPRWRSQRGSDPRAYPEWYVISSSIHTHAILNGSIIADVCNTGARMPSSTPAETFRRSELYAAVASLSAVYTTP